MLNYEENENQELTARNISDIINSVSDDLVFDSLEDQIKNAFISGDSSPMYYVTYFTTKYNFIKNKYSEYPEVIEKIEDIRENFYGRLQALLEDKFKFTVNEFPSTLTKDQVYENIEQLYNFFVIRNRYNSINLIVKYIEKEMKSLIKTYKPLIDKKDLTYINIKKSLNKDIAVIICKLPDIIDSIEISSSQDLLNLLIEDEFEFTNAIMKDLFITKEIITFNEDFISNLITPIKEDDSFYLHARTYFVNKYNDKK